MKHYYHFLFLEVLTQSGAEHQEYRPIAAAIQVEDQLSMIKEE